MATSKGQPHAFWNAQCLLAIMRPAPVYPKHARATRQISGQPYLEGQGGLVNGLIIGIARVTMEVIRLMNLLTKSPGP